MGKSIGWSIFKDYPELAEGFKDDNPLANSASYEVYLSDASMQATLVTYLENLEGVEVLSVQRL